MSTARYKLITDKTSIFNTFAINLARVLIYKPSRTFAAMLFWLRLLISTTLLSSASWSAAASQNLLAGTTTPDESLLTEKEKSCLSLALNIEQKFSCLDGVTFKKLSDDDIANEFNFSNLNADTPLKINLPQSHNVFEVQFRQPIDHDHPENGAFMQKLIIHHLDENEPMVLQTSGYSIFAAKLTVIAELFQTNQIQVEHRFFSESRPGVLNWSLLNIRQSANDFHIITAKFKEIYKGRWIGTGASKGGMTSVYHRRFFPNDLDGTVADVAPLSYSTTDQRYSQFLRQVGGDNYADCREAFKNMQIELLTNRSTFVPDIFGNFTILGNADVAFEHNIIESQFYFWQYGDPDHEVIGCPALKKASNTQAKWLFMQRFANINNYLDDELSAFSPYFYQSATELGGPDNLTDYLEHLRKYEFTVEQYTPRNTQLKYSNESMRNVESWINESAQNILFIYGEFDPWTAGEFRILTNDRSVKKYYVPRGNHGSKFVDLHDTDKAEVIETLTKWLAKKPVPSTLMPLNSNLPPVLRYKNVKCYNCLEKYEFEMRKKHRL